LSNLTYLDLSFNSLSGYLKPWSFPKLTILDLSYNQLEGDISRWKPVTASSTAEKNEHSDFSFLDLSNNLLTGSTIPVWKTFSINLSNNRLSGDVQDLLSQVPPQVATLNLSGNKLKGGFNFTQVNTIESLELLDLRNNSLSGGFVVPPNMRSKIRSLDVSHNQFTGILGKMHARAFAFYPLNSVSEGYGVEDTTMNNFNDVSQGVLFNIANNAFSCPYPKLDDNIHMLKTACSITDMVQVLSVAASIAAVVVCSMYFLYVKMGSGKVSKKQSSPLAKQAGALMVYFKFTALFIFDLSMDIKQYTDEVGAASSGYCAGLNLPTNFVLEVPDNILRYKLVNDVKTNLPTVQVSPKHFGTDATTQKYYEIGKMKLSSSFSL
jgi:hypothetical protein